MLLRNIAKVFLLSMAIINSSCAKTENIPSIKVNASSNAASKNIGNSNDESKIILYMKDHEASGQVISTNLDYQYYRVLLKNLKNQRYLVQDFYRSKHKLTDPYILTNGQLNYVYNEDESLNFYPREGKRTIYYESGKKSAETKYENNRETGVWIEWFENGNKSSETPYLLGKINGNRKELNEKGRLVSECNYINGLENGECYTKYNNNPNIYIYHGYFKNGKKIGLWREWDENGKIIKNSNY